MKRVLVAYPVQPGENAALLKLSRIVASFTIFWPRADEVFTRVWSGKSQLDEWDSFVKALPGMGINDALKIQQNALDRYNKRPG